MMDRAGERQLVYTALFVLCSAIAILAGPMAGIGSFAQVMVVIELAYLIVTPQRGYTGRRG
jgi:hypothetical protein